MNDDYDCIDDICILNKQSKIIKLMIVFRLSISVY